MNIIAWGPQVRKTGTCLVSSKFKVKSVYELAPTKSLAQILGKFLWKGPKGMKVIGVFLNADSESPPMT